MEISRRYIERLLEEWKQHGKVIIAVDFDDTISPWKFHEYNFDRVISTLKEARRTGAYVIIFTQCTEDRYPEIRNYCNKVDLEIDEINTNPIELPYGNSNKPYYNILLDDRAGLTESLEILNHALYKYRGYLQGKQNLPDAG